MNDWDVLAQQGIEIRRRNCPVKEKKKVLEFSNFQAQALKRQFIF